jgi:hypothetical protein
VADDVRPIIAKKFGNTTDSWSFWTSVRIDLFTHIVGKKNLNGVLTVLVGTWFFSLG